MFKRSLLLLSLVMMAAVANDEASEPKAPASTEPTEVVDPVAAAAAAQAKADAAEAAKQAAAEAVKAAEEAKKAADEQAKAADVAAKLEKENANKAKIEAAKAAAKQAADVAEQAAKQAADAKKAADDAQAEADKLEGKDAKKDEAGFFASVSSALKSTGKFAVGMVNPMGWYAAGSAATAGVWKGEFKATGETLWNEHRAAVTGMSVTAILVAAELYDNLVSKAFNKAKAFVEEQLS